MEYSYVDYNLIGNQGVHYLSCAKWPKLIELNLCNYYMHYSQLIIELIVDVQAFSNRPIGNI